MDLVNAIVGVGRITVVIAEVELVHRRFGLTKRQAEGEEEFAERITTLFRPGRGTTGT